MIHLIKKPRLHFLPTLIKGLFDSKSINHSISSSEIISILNPAIFKIGHNKKSLMKGMRQNRMKIKKILIKQRGFISNLKYTQNRPKLK